MSDLSLYNEAEVAEWFVFLDQLRAKKATITSPDTLVREFGLSKERSAFVIERWTKTYDPKITAERRARTVYFAHGGK